MNEKAYLYTIKEAVQAEIKIKRSVFACSLSPIKTPEDAKKIISQISKNNKNATHNCWAWITGEDGHLFHSSDAGEPAGTAGKPMLNALQHAKLTDVAAVVTRYYGGVKLGVRGLIDAYFESVQTAVKKAVLIKNVSMSPCRIEVFYEYNDTVLNKLKGFDIQIIRTDYSDKIIHDIEVETVLKKKLDQFLEGCRSRGWLRIIAL